MTYKYSQKSITQLDTCCVELQEIFHEVIKHTDCTVLQGHRNEEDQNKAYDEGKSQLKWPDGNHNSIPTRLIGRIENA